MTAEIAIMNQSAVALAADSAVTIGNQRGQKIFNTVNKLFALSKHRPVAVMIYGNAQILRAPWETVIKIYRRHLGRSAFDRLEDYAADFLKFVADNRDLFPAAEQEHCLKELIAERYRSINQGIQDAIRQRLEENDQISIVETERLVAAQIQKHFDLLKQVGNLMGFTDEIGTRTIQKHAALVDQLRQYFFQKLPLTPDNLAALDQLTRWLVTRDAFRSSAKSGIVIAGFGERDVYPALQEFHVDGILEDILRHSKRHHMRIGPANRAGIIPFAQSEVVKGFIDGMDPALENLVNVYLDQTFSDYPRVLLDQIPDLSADDKRRIASKMQEASRSILSSFRQQLQTFRDANFVNPVVSTVAVLPKDELAAMAESLVNLTSFKRRFSTDAETVGGPIDVALISKGDGLVWIKRKHYFKPELNPHFLTNYFQDD
jgi:hypothetical protein